MSRDVTLSNGLSRRVSCSIPSTATMGIKGLTALLSEHAPKAITVTQASSTYFPTRANVRAYDY
jgi:hypothetical protein